ncbi:MAG TPA: Amuc_1100 family pilus-like protein [Verrucomicrobiae bacterium]|jgi:hypothetical protein
MPWIKRNLYFVIIMAAGLGVSGYCGYMLWATLNNNAKLSSDFESKESSYKQLKDKKPYPTKENIKAAQDDSERVRVFLEDFRKSFVPFPPPLKVDDREFKEFLQKSIAQFGLDATNAGVNIYPDYAFGFSQQKEKLSFPTECIDPWMEELQQIKTILGILYHAKVNFLEKVRRPNVSPNDIGGDDYTQFTVSTNQYGVVTPYQVEFRAFSKEIADVLAGIAASSNCFVVKVPYVAKSTAPLPDMTQLMQSLAPAAAPALQMPIYRPPFMSPGFGREPGGRDGRSGRGGGEFRRERQFVPRQPEMSPTPEVPSGPVTILTERPLYVTLYIDIIKLKPLAEPATAPGAKPRLAEH